MAKAKGDSFIKSELDDKLDVDISFAGIPGIYCIYNREKDAFYIGSTSDLYKRVNQHKNQLLKNKHPNPFLQRAFNKYGFDAFVFKILKIEPFDTLFECEQYYLDNTRPLYNVNPSATGMRCGHTEQTRKKISEAQFKRVWQWSKAGDFIQEFPSLNAVFAHFGCRKSGGISDCLHGRLSTSKGYKWTYAGQSPSLKTGLKK